MDPAIGHETQAVTQQPQQHGPGPHPSDQAELCLAVQGCGNAFEGIAEGGRPEVGLAGLACGGGKECARREINEPARDDPLLWLGR